MLKRKKEKTIFFTKMFLRNSKVKLMAQCINKGSGACRLIYLNEKTKILLIKKMMVAGKTHTQNHNSP